MNVWGAGTGVGVVLKTAPNGLCRFLVVLSDYCTIVTNYRTKSKWMKGFNVLRFVRVGTHPFGIPHPLVFVVGGILVSL